MNRKKRKLTEEHKIKIRETIKKLFKEDKWISPMKGKNHTREARKKMSETKKRLYAEGKLKPSKLNYNTRKKAVLNRKKNGWWKNPEEAKKRISNAMKGKHWKLSEQTKIRMGLAKIGKKFTEEHKLRLSKKAVIKQRKLWQNEEYKKNQLSKILKGLLKRPTSFEQKIIVLCFKYNLPFIYTGNGNFLINFKNPDFVNEEDKVVIEVFHSYFKITNYGSIENYKEFCRNKYEPSGWKVIFIDELDLNYENWEERCLNKINVIKNIN